MDDETVDTNAKPTELEAELHRWFGTLTSQLSGKVSTAVEATLADARQNLIRILNAASAATKEI